MQSNHGEIGRNWAKAPIFLQLNNDKFEVKESNLKINEQMFMYRTSFSCIELSHRALMMAQEGISFLGKFEQFRNFRKYTKLEKFQYFFDTLMSTWRGGHISTEVAACDMYFHGIRYTKAWRIEKWLSVENFRMNLWKKGYKTVSQRVCKFVKKWKNG